MKKRGLILILKLAITASAIAYLFASGKLRFSDLAVERGGWPWIGCAAAAILLWMAVSQVRHWILLRAGGVDARLRSVMHIGFISWFFNATLLGGLGFVSADAIKAGYLIRLHGKSSAVISSTVLDRVLGILGLMTLAVFALQIGWDETVQTPALRRVAAVLYSLFAAAGLAVLVSVISLAEGRTAAVVAWIVVGGAAAALLTSVWEGIAVPILIVLAPLAIALVAPAFLPGGTLHEKVVKRLWMGDHLSAFLTTLLDYRSRIGALVAGYGLSLVIHGLALLALFYTGRGISIAQEPTLRQIWFAAPPATALNILPLPASGLGVGEATFDAMLRFCAGPDGKPLEGGAALYLSFRILMTVLGLTGLPLFLISPQVKAIVSHDGEEPGTS